jgi:nitric oxide reductase activation protein
MLTRASDTLSQAWNDIEEGIPENPDALTESDRDIFDLAVKQQSRIGKALRALTKELLRRVEA